MLTIARTDGQPEVILLDSLRKAGPAVVRMLEEFIDVLK